MFPILERPFYKITKQLMDTWKKADIPTQEEPLVQTKVTEEFSKLSLPLDKLKEEELDLCLDIAKCQCFCKAKSIMDVDQSTCQCEQNIPANTL